MTKEEFLTNVKQLLPLLETLILEKAERLANSGAVLLNRIEGFPCLVKRALSLDVFLFALVRAEMPHVVGILPANSAFDFNYQTSAIRYHEKINVRMHLAFDFTNPDAVQNQPVGGKATLHLSVNRLLGSTLEEYTRREQRNHSCHICATTRCPRMRGKEDQSHDFRVIR